MHRVPLVVAGPSVLDPYEQYEARVLDDTDDVVAACEEVAAGELARHSRIASEALRVVADPERRKRRTAAGIGDVPAQGRPAS